MDLPILYGMLFYAGFVFVILSILSGVIYFYVKYTGQKV